MADFVAFAQARDAGAGALWLLALALGGLVALLPARWRPWAIVGLAVYVVLGAMLWTH